MLSRQAVEGFTVQLLSVAFLFAKMKVSVVSASHLTNAQKEFGWSSKNTGICWLITSLLNCPSVNRRFQKNDEQSSVCIFIACECGAEEQTVDHVVPEGPIHRPPHGLHSLAVPDDETIEWMLNTCPEI